MRDIKQDMKRFGAWASKEVKRPVGEWLLDPFQWVFALMALLATTTGIFQWLEEEPTPLGLAGWPLIALIWMAGMRVQEKFFDSAQRSFNRLVEICNDWQKLYERLDGRYEELKRKLTGPVIH